MIGNFVETHDPSSGGDLYVFSSRGFSGIQVTLNYFLIASDRRGLSLSARSGDRKRPVLRVKAVRRWRGGRGGQALGTEGGRGKAGDARLMAGVIFLIGKWSSVIKRDLRSFFFSRFQSGLRQA